MKYNELKLTKQKVATRPGRGISAGGGKTAGRGTKGQGSRKSSNVRLGFEGGQIPLYMRLPHLRGFKSHRTKPDIIFTGQLESIKKAVIDNNTLYEAGLTSNPYSSVKLLVKGDLASKKDVKLQSASKSAQAMLKKTGGSFTPIPRQGREKVKTAKIE